MTCSPESSGILDADSRVRQSIACLGCEYDLRGLSCDSRCPECGEAVTKSVFHGRLHFADAFWLRRMSAGCRWLTIGIVLGFCSGGNTVGNELSPTGVLWSAAAAVLILIGFWFVCSDEPTGDQPFDPVADRRTLSTPRMIALAAAVYLILPIELLVPEVGSLHRLSAGLAMLTLPLLVWWAARRLRPLARRIPDMPLGRTCAASSFMVCAGMGLLGLLAILSEFARAGSGAARSQSVSLIDDSIVPPWLAIPLAVGTMVGAFVFVLVLWDFRGAFKRAARYARGISEINEYCASSTARQSATD